MDTLSYIIGRNSAGGGGGSTPTWNSITGKPFSTVGAGLEVEGGALKEAVPLYTETSSTSYGPGLVITNWFTDSVNKAIADDSVVLFNSDGDYNLTAKLDGEICTGIWDVNNSAWTYGSYGYAFSYSIEAGGKGSDLKFEFNFYGSSPNIDWVVIKPLDPNEPCLTEANVTAIGFMDSTSAYWGTKQEGSSTVHELPAEYIATALTPYVQSSALTPVAFSGSYNDLTDTPIIPAATSVTVTHTLSSGTAIADIDVDGITTTLYAPASSGADVPVEWGNSSKNSAILMNSNFMVDATGQNSVVLVSGQVYGQSGIALNAGTVSGQNGLAWGRNTSINQNASNGMALGEGVQIQGSHSKAIGRNITMNTNVGDRIYIGDYLQDNANTTAPKFIRGQYNDIAYGVTYPTYLDLVGNGTADNARSNAEATDMSGNKYLAGDIYTHVTDWADPQNNSTKLAPVPVCSGEFSASSDGETRQFVLKCVSTATENGTDPETGDPIYEYSVSYIWEEIAPE